MSTEAMGDADESDFAAPLDTPETDVEQADPFGGLTYDKAAFVAAYDFIESIAPDAKGLGAVVVRLQGLLVAWYEAGAGS